MKTEKKLSNAIANFMDMYIHPENLEKTHLALIAFKKDTLTPDQAKLIQELVLASITMGFVIHNNPSKVEVVVDQLAV